MQVKVGVGVRLRLGLGSMSNNFELFEEELNAGTGWGRDQIDVGVNVN